jgi:hypothetical protein
MMGTTGKLITAPPRFELSLALSALHVVHLLRPSVAGWPGIEISFVIVSPITQRRQSGMAMRLALPGSRSTLSGHEPGC